MIKLKQWVIPFLVLLLLFLADGTITAVFNELLFINPGIMFPRLLFVGLVYYSFRLPLKQMLTFAVILGLLQDSYYVGVLGIYITAYAVVVYVTSMIKKSIDINVLTISLSMVILLLIFELIIYMLYFFIGFTRMGISEFIILRYAPTVLFNSFAYFICYYPLKISANAALR